MGWGSIAEKLNRTIGGYTSEEEVAKEAKAEPKVESTKKADPPIPAEQATPETARPSKNPMEWEPPIEHSIYDAPAITRQSIPVEDAPINTVKPKRGRKPKLEKAPKEEVAAVAT